MLRSVPPLFLLCITISTLLLSETVALEFSIIPDCVHPLEGGLDADGR
jgi:hypothetical protein